MSGSYKIGLGILGEMLANAVLSTLYPKCKGYIVQHQNWRKNYVMGEGLDLQDKDSHKRSLVDVEVKNWKKQPRTYGIQTAKDEILSRFSNSTAKLKLLIITYLSLLSKDAIQLIRSCGIQIIELGDLVTKQTFRQLFQNGIKRLKSILFGERALSTQHKLVEYLSNNNNANSINTNTTEIHDTNIEFREKTELEDSMLAFYMRALVWFCEQIGKQRAQIKHVAKQND